MIYGSPTCLNRRLYVARCRTLVLIAVVKQLFCPDYHLGYTAYFDQLLNTAGYL